MAANMQQMVPNGQMMMMQQQQQQQQQQQPQQQQHHQNKQLNNLVYSHLMQTMSMAPLNSWQHGVSIGDRFAKAINLVSNTILAYPSNDWQKVCQTAMELEKKAFLQSPDKQSYDHAMAGRTADMVKRRQGLVPDLQNQLSTDAARQAQIQQAQQQAQAQQRQHQLFMNQIAARGLSQPPQQFQPMQNPTQVPGLPQQPQQLNMGMPNPAMLQNRPDQRPFQLQMPPARQQPPFFQFDAMSRLSPEDRVRVNDYASRLMNAAEDQQKNQIRQALQQRLTPAQQQDMALHNRDPLFAWYQSQALKNFQQVQARNQMQQRAGMPANVMQPGPHQGQMNPALMGAMGRQQVMPDGQAFAPNMESIRSEQQMGLLAQRAGQMVVPASGAPGQTQAPGPMGAIPPQPAAGGQQGPTPTQRPTQMPGFNMGQTKMDPTAAQAQAQQAMRAVPGRPMPGQPGQPGAMATPNPQMQQSQSPAMNTLNAPMRQPPIPMGQGNGQPMNQGNPPMAATLNPQFNHQNNTRPPSLQGGMNNQGMGGMAANLNADARANMAAGMADSTAMREFFAKMQEQQRATANGFQGAKPGMMSGLPGQPQPGPVGGPNQAAMVNANQNSNGTMQPTLQPATMMQQQQQQQQQQAERQQFLAFAQTNQARQAMSLMDVNPQILDRLRSMGLQLSADIRKWGQLRQLLNSMINNNPAAVPVSLQTQINSWQLMQFRTMIAQQKKAAGPSVAAPQAAQVPQAVQVPQIAQVPQASQVPQIPQVTQPSNGQGPQQPQSQTAQLPPGFVYPPNLNHITREEIENTRQRDARLTNLSDQELMNFLVRFRRQAWSKQAWEKYNQDQQQMRANTNPASGMQKPGMPVTQPPTTVQGGVVPAPQLNVSQGVQVPAAPAPEPVTAPGAGAPKNSRQPPKASPAPAPKSLKRPSPDDASDAPNRQANAPQRPAPQGEARPAHPAAAKPTTEQLMKLSPEQLAKITPEQLAKLTPEQQTLVMRSRAAQQGNFDTVARLKELANDGHKLAAMEVQQNGEVPIPANEVNEARAKLVQAAERIKQLRGSSNIARWYHLTKDDARARMFFTTRYKVVRHFENEGMVQLRASPVTVTCAELDQYINMMDSMLQDLGVLKRSASQEGGAAGVQAEAQRQSQPAPLNAANLERQTQALKKAQNGTVNKPAQAPAAPTTTQPPFQFGIGKSPAGNPEYLSEQRIKPEHLVIPPRKKAKTGPGQSAASANQQPARGSASPQVNPPSPVAVRKPEPPKLTCPEPGCEMSSTGFPTEEALNAHRQEEHIKPFENPMGFLKEEMAAALGLDPQGKAKVPPKPVNQPTPAATPMQLSRSMQGQKPGAPAMSRGASMQRQGSAASGKPTAAKQAGGTPQPPITEDPWLNSTVDPMDLTSNLAHSLEAVTGTVVPDFGTYRSLTPNDTPESSKDSGASEPTSDIATDVALDIGLNFHQPLDNDMMYDLNNIQMENFDEPDFGHGFGGAATSMFAVVDEAEVYTHGEIMDLMGPGYPGMVQVSGGGAGEDGEGFGGFGVSKGMFM